MQIQLYFAETMHPAYGILRTMVKDSTNHDSVNSYMDSNGRVAAQFLNFADSLPSWQQQFFGDGLWHMATLTTLSDDPHGLQGHAMFLDGNLVALQRADVLYTGAFWCNSRCYLVLRAIAWQLRSAGCWRCGHALCMCVCMHVLMSYHRLHAHTAPSSSNVHLLTHDDLTCGAQDTAHAVTNPYVTV